MEHLDFFLKQYNSNIYTYPIIGRDVLCKYYGENDSGTLDSLTLKIRLRRRLKLFRQFDLRNKSILDLGSSLGTYLYFLDCESIVGVENDIGVLMTNKLIQRYIKPKCKNITFHKDIPYKRYDYCFVLTRMWCKKSNNSYTIQDYKNIMSKYDIQSIVFMEQLDDYYEKILCDTQKTVINVEPLKLFVVDRNQW